MSAKSAIEKCRCSCYNHGMNDPLTYDLCQVTNPKNFQNRRSGDPFHTIAKDNAGRSAVVYPGFVRQVTPAECERLQGFPAGHTAVPHRGRPSPDCPDGPRYRAAGNSMAVAVMRWIGQRVGMSRPGANLCRRAP